MGAVAVFFIRERIPVARRAPGSSQSAPKRSIPLTFLKSSPFWAFTGAMLLTSLGNFVPSIYLPSYAVDLGLSTLSGTLLVSMMKLVKGYRLPDRMLTYRVSDCIGLQCVLYRRSSCPRIPER